jgi:hypothetical protein
VRAKEYLKQLETLDVKIGQKMQQAQELRLIATSGGGGIDYSKDRVKTSPSGDTLSDAVIRYAALEEAIDRDIDQFVDTKNLIINQIQGLSNPDYMRLLYKRYVEFKHLDEIADEMRYTYQYTRQLHGYALAEFERTYPNIFSSVT